MRLRPAYVFLTFVAFRIHAFGTDNAPVTTTRPAITGTSIAIQNEPEDLQNGRYDWGPCVVRDGSLYRMWWVRLGGSGQARRFPYQATLPHGEHFEFTYPDWGDRIYYAESRDGRRWNISGPDFDRPAGEYGPEAPGPLRVLGPAESAQQRNHLAAPTIIKVKDTWYLYIEACCEFVVRRNAQGKIVVGDEYHNQVFLATSPDGRTWHQYPSDQNPQPVVAAPQANKLEGRRRYGLGQPSVSYWKNRFVMHYVDSCTGPGDFIVRIEADNPWFRNATPAKPCLIAPAGSPPFPAGAVARFAQTDVHYLDNEWLLTRSIYETGCVALLRSPDGIFASDQKAGHPRDVWPQVAVRDHRGADYTDRLFPRFLTDPHGQVLTEDGKVVVYCGSGRKGKGAAWSWDLRRVEIPLQ